MVSLKGLDMFPKVQAGLSEARRSGGLMTLIGIGLAVLLMLDEVVHYTSSVWTSRIGVDTRPLAGQEHVYIYLDMDLPGMNCDQFGLDVTDITGELQLGADSQIEKTPRGAGKGCRLHGGLEVHNVDGEFHVAFGRMAKPSQGQTRFITPTMSHVTGHVHQFTREELGFFNASHKITALMFGFARDAVTARRAGDGGLFAALQGKERSPLQGESHIVTHDTARFVYFLKIVPTIRQYADGRVTYSYEYSHRLQAEEVVIGPTFRQPGIYFKFEVSPYIVTYTQMKRSFSHLVASCAAIIGGVYTVSGILAQFIASTHDRQKAHKAKQEADSMAVPDDAQEFISNSSVPMNNLASTIPVPRHTAVAAAPANEGLVDGGNEMEEEEETAAAPVAQPLGFSAPVSPFSTPFPSVNPLPAAKDSAKFD